MAPEQVAMKASVAPGEVIGVTAVGVRKFAIVTAPNAPDDALPRSLTVGQRELWDDPDELAVEAFVEVGRLAANLADAVGGLFILAVSVDGLWGF